MFPVSQLLGVVAYNLCLFAGIKLYFLYRNRQKKNEWKQLTKDERERYVRKVAPHEGNKSLLFEFKH